MTFPLHPRQVEIGAWLLLCAGLAFLVVRGLQAGATPVAPAGALTAGAAASDMAAPPLLAVAPPLPLEQHPAIVERPLLLSTRRPAAAVAANMTAIHRLYRLAGVSIIGGRKIAYLVDLASGTTQAIREGGQIGRLTVSRIEPGEVHFTQGGETEVLPLRVLLSVPADPAGGQRRPADEAAAPAGFPETGPRPPDPADPDMRPESSDAARRGASP